MNSPDLYGWDTVFAINLATANTALSSLPASPAYSKDVPVGNGSASLAWSFSTWSFADVSGGAHVTIEMRFGAGSVFTINSAATDLGGPDFACSVDFAAFFTDDGKLVANTKGQTWATVQIKAPASFSSTNKTVLQAILNDWFGKSSDAVKFFEQELLSLDMSKDIAKDELPWLLPHSLGFAGGTMDDGTKAIGILAMTQPGKAASTGQLQLSPYAIPANSPAGFLISRELFMQNLILGAIAGTFSDDDKGDTNHFTIDGHDFGIRNNAELSFKHDVDGTPQACTIAPNGLAVIQDGNKLKLDLYGMSITTSIAGLLVDANIHEEMEISLVRKSDQNGVLALEDVNSRPPELSHHYTGTATVTMAVIGSAIALVATALAVWGPKGALKKMNLTDIQAKVLARVIVAVVGLVSAAISLVPLIITALKDGDPEKIPEMTPLISTQLGRIVWPGSTKTKFVAVTAALADCLQFAVEPTFA